MRILKFTALATAIALLPASAMAGGDSRGGHGGMPRVGGHHGGTMVGHGGRNWGTRYQGRWVGGHRAPGGWNSYRRLGRGYSLPRYWLNQAFYIPNYSYYGFTQPAYGYTWTRYYDDAAMVDQWGRVYDYRQNVDWDRYDAYDDEYQTSAYDQGGYYPQGGTGSYGNYSDSYGYDERYSGGHRSNNGLGGAIAGGAVGAIAGAAIAGRGDRTEGAVIGGMGGAVLGAIVGSDSDRKARKRARKAAERYDRDYGYQSGGYQGGGYQGGGYYNPVYGQQAGAQYGDGGYGPDFGNTVDVAPQPAPAPMPAPSYGYGHHGYYGYGYGQPTVTTVTIQPQPVVTTTTTTEYVTEYVSVPARKRVYRAAPKKHYKPKPRCVCKVVYR